MGKNVVKIYGDGEIWLDGHKKGKIYPDGEVYINGSRIGRIYEDGDIWIDGKQAGRVFANGDVWIGSKKVASGVYLLDLLGDSDPPPPRDTDSDTSCSNSFGNAASRFANVRNQMSDSNVGCGFIFVAILLIVAFIYGAFHFWLTELPTLLFGNMQIMGTAAMLSTYLCMAAVAYLHCSMATRNKEPMFLKALLMQAAVFFANIIVFTVFDLIALALSYGFSIGDALGEIGGALGGSLLGMILIAVFVGLAPTIVSSFISFLCIKKGKIVPLPTKMKKVNFTAPKAKGVNFTVPKVDFTVPNIRDINFTVPRAKKSYSRRTWSIYWDGERIAKALMSLCFVSFFVFFLSTLPMSLFMEFEEFEFEARSLILPALAVVVGILLRRKLWVEGSDGFILGWVVQSAVLIVACFANWILDTGISSIFALPDIALSCCGMCFILGLFVTFFTLTFAKD